MLSIFLKGLKNWIRTVIRDIDYDLIVQASKKEAVVYKCPIKRYSELFRKNHNKNFFAGDSF